MSFTWLFFPARKHKLIVINSVQEHNWLSHLPQTLEKLSLLSYRVQVFTGAFQPPRFCAGFHMHISTNLSQRFWELLIIARCCYSARLCVGALRCNLTRQDKPVLSTHVLRLSKYLALSFSGYSTFFLSKRVYSTKHPKFKMISLDIQSVRSHVTELPRRRIIWDLK
jgi:hypothetical protein